MTGDNPSVGGWIFNERVGGGRYVKGNDTGQILRTRWVGYPPVRETLRYLPRVTPSTPWFFLKSLSRGADMYASPKRYGDDS